MTHSPDWDNCNIAAAASELKAMIPIMLQIGRQENPDSDLYFSRHLTDAIRLVISSPTIANAKALCVLTPDFEQICFRQTPQGKIFEMGELFGSALFQKTITSTEAFFDLHSHTIKRAKNNFILDHMLVTAYLAENLIGNKNPMQKQSLIDGVRSQFANCAASNKLPNDTNQSTTETFELSCLQFSRYADSVSGKLDENTLRVIIATMSGGKPDLSNRYKGFLGITSDDILELIHELLTREADKSNI